MARKDASYSKPITDASPVCASGSWEYHSATDSLCSLP